MLPEALASDPVFEQRFRREAFAAAGLTDPHVVPIHNFGDIDGRLYVDMRLIEGRDLQSLLADGPTEPARAVWIIDQVASALHAAHRIGLVHRDVKPSNILVTEDDFAYLIDFGIARTVGETALTSTGSVIGTWAYMAPERLANGQTDARADIYALTCVLHECLTGTRPFPGDSLEQQITGHLTVPPPRPSELSADVPAELDTVVATGMAKNPDERYETAKDLARAARAAIIAPTADPSPSVALTEPAPAHHEVSHIAPTQYGPPTGPRPQTPALEPADNKKPRRRFRIVLAAGIGVIAIVGVVAGVLVINRDKAGDAEPAPAPFPTAGLSPGCSTWNSVPARTRTARRARTARRPRKPGRSGRCAVTAAVSQQPLPQPPEDPIAKLVGKGRHDDSNTACASSDFDATFDRTGD